VLNAISGPFCKIFHSQKSQKSSILAAFSLKMAFKVPKPKNHHLLAFDALKDDLRIVSPYQLLLRIAIDPNKSPQA